MIHEHMMVGAVGRGDGDGARDCIWYERVNARMENALLGRAAFLKCPQTASTVRNH